MIKSMAKLLEGWDNAIQVCKICNPQRDLQSHELQILDWITESFL